SQGSGAHIAGATAAKKRGGTPDSPPARTPRVSAGGVPALKMARNTTNLANQPASGGIPASAKRNADIKRASTGAVCPSPEYEAISPDRVRRGAGGPPPHPPPGPPPAMGRENTPASHPR